MKYILMDYKDGDCFTAEFESKEEALQEAEGQWEHLTRCDPVSYTHLAAGLLTPGSEILLKNVGINPTRDGMLRVCKAMGADITLLNASTEGEPTACLLYTSSAWEILSSSPFFTALNLLQVYGVERNAFG